MESFRDVGMFVGNACVVIMFSCSMCPTITSFESVVAVCGVWCVYRFVIVCYIGYIAVLAVLYWFCVDVLAG